MSRARFGSIENDAAPRSLSRTASTTRPGRERRKLAARNTASTTPTRVK